MSEELLCKDCVHSRNHWWRFLGEHNYYCSLGTIKGTISLVNGSSTVDKLMPCSMARSRRDICGFDAEKWTPKDTAKNMFTLLKRNYDITT